MSQENVERVRAYLELWNGHQLRPEERPWEVVYDPVALALFDPEPTYADSILPDHAGEEYHGLDGIARSWEGWMEDYDWLQVELEDIIDAGEYVVSIHKAQARMRHTGLEFASPLAYVYTFHEGKCVRAETFVDVAAALKSAGLEA